MIDWRIFKAGTGPHDGLAMLRTAAVAQVERGRVPGQAGASAIRSRGREVVGGADPLVELRCPCRERGALSARPLLVTGKPGVGKCSSAYAVAYQLRMGPVLEWPMTSRAR